MRIGCDTTSNNRGLVSRLLGRVALFLFGFLMAQLSFAQQMAGTGTITGHILCGDNGAPARYVHVTLVPALNIGGGESPKQTRLESSTDRDGDIVFSNVAAGTYFVDAALLGYLQPLHFVSKDALQSKDPEVRKLVFDRIPHVTLESMTSAHFAFALERGSAVSGRVAYDDTAPIESVGVQVVRVKDADSVQADGRKTIYKKEYEARAETDDRGLYRVAGLPAGTYTVSAKIAMNHLQVHPGPKNSFTMSVTQPGDVNLIFYAPATAQRIKAQEFNVAQGDERQGIDLVADLTHLHSIGGFVQRQGRRLAGAGFELKDESDPENRHGTVADETGFFRFDLLPEGAYQLMVYTPSSGTGEVEAGERKPAMSIPVIVKNADVLDLSIEVQNAVATQPAVR